MRGSCRETGSSAKNHPIPRRNPACSSLPCPCRPVPRPRSRRCCRRGCPRSRGRRRAGRGRARAAGGRRGAAPARPPPSARGRRRGRGFDQEGDAEGRGSWTGARPRARRPGRRKRVRIDGKGGKGGARRGHRAPMLLSGLWDDGTTAAQLVVNVKKTNEITVAPRLLKKIPAGELEGAVITADKMHTQLRLALPICAKLHARDIFTLFWR